MRILLAHNSLYYPSFGGGDKSNRLLVEALAARGHEVSVVARVERFERGEHDALVSALRERGIEPVVDSAAGVVRASVRGVDVHVLTLDPRVRAYFAKRIEQFDPDVILSSTDDPGHILLEVALRAGRARVVYLVRAPLALPFGPAASTQSVAKTETIRRVDGMVGVSEAVARYVREYSGIPCVHVPISLMERRDFPALGSFDNPYITLVNPCAVKGLAVFLALAEHMPQLRFAAVPTWGTNEEDAAALRRVPNVAVLDPVENVDELFARTRVLLVPSLWMEARSRIVPEAMARGVPVIASDQGGLVEAMLGVPYTLPVNPIVHYKPALDARMVPVADVPPQDIQPWAAALERLTTDRAHYEEVSRASREAALRYVHDLSAEPFERYLEEIVRAEKRAATAPSSTSRLSAEKRRLLALRLARKEAPSWFPNCGGASARLFCFPWAGGGTLLYRTWQQALGSRIRVCAAQLPGREMRVNETPVDSMRELIHALLAALPSDDGVPFAFFGHSMGAGVAFELTRAVRRAGRRLPVALLVSAARAPHLRDKPAPEPSREELIEQLRRLEELPQRADVLELALPVLQADTRLYRNYVYEPAEPLDIPVYAYAGESDPNLPVDAVSAWRQETKGAFRFGTLPGGHFFIRDGAFVNALVEDLKRVFPVASQK